MKKTIIALLIIALISFIAGVYLVDRAFVPNNDDVSQPVANNRTTPITDDIEKPIIVGIYNSGYLYHESHDHGINKDIVEELFKRMKLDYRIEILPRVRISSMLSDGLIHIGVSTVEIPERAEYLYFIPYFSEKNDVLARSDSGISTEKELLQRRDMKVGIVRGYYYGEYYSNLIKKLEEQKMIVQARDTKHLYQMLADGWIQVTFNFATSYLFYFDYYNIQDINIFDWAPNEEPLVRNLAFSKQYFTPNDIARFQQTIDEMMDDGTLYNIFNKYVSDDNAKRMCIQ